MTNLIEIERWEDGIYQLETSDAVVGGPDGIDNLQAKQLANRTRYLKRAIEARQSDFDAHVAAVDPHPQYATHADLAEKVAALVAQSPEALDTLSELAKALGNDPNFATTITTELATRAPIDSPVFTGMPKTSTPAQFDSSDRLAPTGFVQRALGNMQIGTRIQSAANAILSASHAGGFYTLEVCVHDLHAPVACVCKARRDVRISGDGKRRYGRDGRGRQDDDRFACIVVDVRAEQRRYGEICIGRHVLGACRRIGRVAPVAG